MGADAKLFRPVSTGRVSGEIVEQVKQALRQGKLAPGDRLPPERQLTETFGVSRVTVRDALRVLEAHGLIEIRVGAGGGAFVTAPDPGDVADGITNMLMMSAISPKDVTEIRNIIEIGMMPLICERATDSDLEELGLICERADESLDDPPYDVRISAEFHIRLAQSSHNTAILMLTESLHRPILNSLLEAKKVDPNYGVWGTEEHKELVDAIRERDVDRARDILRHHLARTADRLERALPSARTVR